MPDKKPASSLKMDKTLKTLLSWKAPSRVFKRRDKDYFTTLGSIVFLVIIILFFLKEWFLILAIIAFAFVTYVLATVRPEEVEYSITNKGISISGKTFPWETLKNFWFEQKLNQKIVVIQTTTSLPGRIVFVLGDKSEDEVKKTLLKYIPLEKPEDVWVDKASRWISEKVPLEKES